MDQDLVAKNIAYQEEVVQIAKFVFHAFYYDEEEHQVAPDLYEREGVNDLLPRAEKIFHFFGTAAEAKKALRFLHTVNPMKAQEIIDEL